MKRAMIVNWLLVGSLLAASQGFETGLTAYESGNYQTAREVWEPLAEAGDADAAFYLGQMYFVGRGAPQNYGLATQWLRTAAAKGHPTARVVLSEAYLPGRAAPKEGAAALDWYRQLASAGDVVAQYMLARMLDRVRGEETLEEAVRWLRLAAGKEFAPAQRVLAQWYDAGHGLTRDPDQALEFIRAAAANGDADAALALGLAYSTGKGVERDAVRGYAWVRRAAVAGSLRASNELARLAGTLDGEQRTAGDALAGELLEETVYLPFEWREGVYLSGLGPISQPEFDPDYPPPPWQGLESDSRISIALELLIEADGSVAEVNLLHSDDSEAARSLADSLMQVRFLPAQLEGKPVAVLHTYSLYSLGQP